ncbi:DMT family transporter [Labrys monachus]|uniref:Drug/metabolite transporter (DMT)-like permease n=1 Tax=Labrys monachus TaxID=217067 RepID=A0ABU0F822_9HYPH|nr:DMT family transporter [Labrys monachus]MDQ0390760.1 drug/metabolite transporter (DMT)-like permease [Labrys monachus]
MRELTPTAAAMSGGQARLPRDSAALGAMAGAVMAIAWSPILIRFAGLDPAASAFWRLVFALPVLILWSRAERQPGRVSGLARPGLLAALLAGVAFAFDLVCYHAALPLTSVANASFISNLAPVVSVAAGFVLLGDRLRPAALGALLVAVIGIVVTSSAYRSGFAMRLGDVFAVGSALTYAFYLVALRVARRTRGAADVTLVSTVMAGIVLLGLSAAGGDGRFWPQGWSNWAAVVALGLVCQVLGQGLSAVGIGRLPASVVAVILLSHPILSAALAFLIFGEAMNLDQIVGGALILGAVVLSQR